MVPVYEKLLEKVVSEQFIKYFENNTCLSKNQAGFRHENSCKCELQTVVINWKSAIRRKKIMGVIFLDFRTETINRKLLLEKLKRNGVQGTVITWSVDYLQN